MAHERVDLQRAAEVPEWRQRIRLLLHYQCERALTYSANILASGSPIPLFIWTSMRSIASRCSGEPSCTERVYASCSRTVPAILPTVRRAMMPVLGRASAVGSDAWWRCSARMCENEKTSSRSETSVVGRDETSECEDRGSGRPPQGSMPPPARSGQDGSVQW